MKYTLLSIALLCATACLAQVSLETCQRQAQHNFPLIKRRALYAQSTAFTIANLKKGWLPQVQATAQATIQNRVAELPSELNGMLTAMGRDLRGLAKEQYRVGVDVNQMLWDGGRIGAQRQVALLQQQANEAQTDVSLYQVRQRVNDLYFGILLIDERLQLNTDLQTLLLSNENKLAALQKQGVALQSDVDQPPANCNTHDRRFARCWLCFATLTASTALKNQHQQIFKRLQKMFGLSLKSSTCNCALWLRSNAHCIVRCFPH